MTMTTEQTLYLVAALLLALVAAAMAAYERGHYNGRRAGIREHQCADELRLVAVAGSRQRHPSAR
jgi:hypothetical protein